MAGRRADSETLKETTAGRGSAATENDGLAGELQNLANATATWAVSSVANRLEGVTNRLTDYAENGGSGLMAAVGGGAGAKNPVQGVVKKAIGTGLGSLNPFSRKQPTGKSAKKAKVTNIIETVDVGVSARMAYDQWTRFTDFPSFTKKVENVEQESDERLRWRAKVFWSTREWESTIIEQVPDKRIVWRSKGAKGHVDGAVTFHEVAPDLTRIILVLEYHPQGLFEKTGNIWRAQGRRARLEFKHFRRHVMTQSLLHPEEIEGWRGEIRDGEVVDTGTDAPEDEEDQAAADSGESRRPAKSSTRTTGGSRSRTKSATKKRTEK